MAEINSHVILSCMDSPTRILIWPASQVLVCSLPFALGMVTDHVLIGLVMTFISSVLFKMFRKRFGIGKLRSILYWHLPTSSNLVNKGLPPSYVRFWIK